MIKKPCWRNFLFPLPAGIYILAKEACISESKLKQMFKEYTGMGMYAFYQQNRLQKAKVVLKKRQHTVKEVAALFGYESMSNFTHAFKKHFSQLPSEI